MSNPNRVKDKFDEYRVYIPFQGVASTNIAATFWCLHEVKTANQPNQGGICHQAERTEQLISFGWCMSLTDLFNDWEEHSGAPMYPVPHPKRELEILTAMQEGSYREQLTRKQVTKQAAMYAFCNKPLWGGEYGAARRRLLAHAYLDVVEYLGLLN